MPDGTGMMRQGGYCNYSARCNRPGYPLRVSGLFLFPEYQGFPELSGVYRALLGCRRRANTCPIPAENKGTFTIMLGLDRIVSCSALLQIQCGAQEGQTQESSQMIKSKPAFWQVSSRKGAALLRRAQ
jgi:hypothetical protein